MRDSKSVIAGHVRCAGQDPTPHLVQERVPPHINPILYAVSHSWKWWSCRIDHFSNRKPMTMHFERPLAVASEELPLPHLLWYALDQIKRIFFFFVETGNGASRVSLLFFIPGIHISLRGIRHHTLLWSHTLQRKLRKRPVSLSVCPALVISCFCYQVHGQLLLVSWMSSRCYLVITRVVISR